MKPAASSKKLAIVMALVVGGFALWWYFKPFLWLGIILAVLSGIFTYFLLTTKRMERFRLFFFIGLFVVILVTFSVIIEIWNPDFILNWAPQHLSWMKYYSSGEAPGTLSFPCNRMVSQVFFGQAAYLPGFWVWQTQFPTTLGAFLLVMLPFLVTGIIFGRGFCGWICPFGGLPEAMATGKRERWQLNFLKEKATTSGGFHYPKLKAWVKDARFGILLALILLSVFLAFPVVCIVCPALWLSFMPVFWIVAVLTVVFAIVLPFMTKRRWWCHICPIGATISILDNISFFRVRIDKEKCIKCMKCTQECHMFAMEPAAVEGKGAPDFDCIRCGRCIEVCPTEAIDIYWFKTPLKARSLFISLSIIAVMAWYIWFFVLIADKIINLF
jgi:polyferredoxin